ncbi:cobalt transporter CbiM [Anaerobacillus alkaliphilus]|uniref:Cobalt transporter CbiM n=1 Tax=Anaerobacillus alkaliphilus TaxID=1548597 RepID=A0A4Q0VS66_9BACI|nr:CbiM family transporter [Anaerobacillus alkaliphilus]RXJ00311.1 cobalt transporter CbiM [Anaerobacillus alkaliphilus]
MHVADGVLSVSVAVGTSIAAIGLITYSLKGIKEEEVPKISLLTGAFFVSSLINIPIGPTSVHPLLGGFLGLVLGRRAPLGIFIGLILQATLFQHGGLSTLGANTLLMSIPALFVYWLATIFKNYPVFWKGFFSGFLAICGGVLLLMVLLLFSDSRYGEGTFSVINILLIAYLPLAFLEGVLTGFSVKYLYSVRPSLFERGVGLKK